MRLFLPALFFSLFISGALAQTSTDQTSDNLVCARMKYLLNLKKQVGKDHWPAYAEKGVENEIRFYTKRTLYLVHPQAATLKEVNTEKCRCPGLDLYRIKDSVNTSYQMFTNFADGIAACNDLELARQYIPDVNDTETWAVMIVHEMFHQYQTNHKPFRQRAYEMLTGGMYLSHDSIRTIYKHYPFFRDALRQENDLLLACLQSSDKAAVDSMLTQLLKIRKERQERYRRETGFDITVKEDFEQIAEAGTRYIEYHLSNDLKKYPVDKSLAAADTSYRKNRGFQRYSLPREGAYLFTLSPTYYYALGFNSIRLLEKLGLSFKEQMYARPDYSFTKVFEEYLQKRKQ